MNILRIVAKSIVAWLIAMALLLGAGGTAVAAPTGPITARPDRIDFTWVGGKQQFAAANLDRLRRTVFLLSPDGRFEMRQPDGYPTLRGPLNGDGTFEATFSTSSGVGQIRADASGQVGVRDGVAFLNLTYTAGNAMGANVNDVQFSSNSSKAYRATMTLRPA